MFIKQIEITNFKSFKDKTILSFHKNSNVIVGKNGSGKSNLITALELVICCPKIEPKERKNFMHEGEGDCKIEIIFDNSLQRISNTKILILTRIINLNNDFFYLNSKLINREEVKGLFESGGIPITSPYFMVLQGKINSLINLSNEQRYNLIKSIAGVSKYEEDRERSLKMLEETKQTQSKIELILERIMNKLEGLEKDKKVLEENEELEKEKRRLEIGYKQREILEINDEIKDGRDGDCGGRVDDGSKVEDWDRVEGGSRVENMDHKDNITDHYLDSEDIEFELQEIRNKINQSFKNTKIVKEKNNINDYLEPKISLLSNQLKDLNLKKSKIKEIYEKNLIELESLKKLKKEIEEKGKGKGGVGVEGKGDLNELEKEIKKLEGQSKEDQSEQRDKDLNFNFDFISLKSLVEKRNELWREEKGLKNELKGIEEELKGIGNRMVLNMGMKDVFEEGRVEGREEGGSKVEDSKDSMNKDLNPLPTSHPSSLPNLNPALNTPKPHPLSKGILLLDLFDIPEDLIPAFESVAGHHLFSVVIENESLIPSLPYKDCTFIPLNRMFYKEAPLLENEDLFLLSSKIKINNINEDDPRVFTLLRFITKNTFVSSDIKSSNFFSKKFKINVVTLDGDFFSRTGVITGGFNEKKKILIEYKRNKKNKKEIERKIEKNKKEIEKVNKEIKRGEECSEDDCEGMLMEGREKGGSEGGKEPLSINSSNPNQGINSINETRGINETKDINETQGINNQVTTIPPSSLLTKIKISYLKNKISYLKNPNFIKFNEIQNLEFKILAIKGEEETLLENINFIKKRLKKYNQKFVHENCHNIDDNDNNHHLLLKEKSLSDLLKNKKIFKIEKFEDLENQKHKIKKHVLYAKRLDLMKKIGIENYKEMDLIYPNLSKEDLFLKIKEIVNKLKKFDFINKRALTQWNSHLEQKETLKIRLNELKENLKKIKEFIKELDGKKEKFLEFTFEMVRMNFRGFSKKMIFEMDMEIVGGSGGCEVEGSKMRGSKVGLGKNRVDDALSKEDALDERGLGLSKGDDLPINLDNNLPKNTKSISITHNNLPLDLNLLSGGQKTMIALCLIFSIQKIDPSPFYIFDEVDANLDKQSREKITQLFKDTVKNEDVQFIITTFKEELVECGNKFIGVSFKEKKSYLGEVSKEVVSEFMSEI